MEDQEHTHPYVAYQGSEMWRVVDAALTDLENNQDIKITTAREYVIGYLCKVIDSVKG